MKRFGAAVFVLVASSVAGGAVGWWWTTTTEQAICARLEADCGDDAMAMTDCLEGRQRELMSGGVSRLRQVEACLKKAPRDCVSATACVVGD